MQNIFHLAFAAGVCGNADALVSSDDGGYVTAWSVCPSAGLFCIWQVRTGTCSCYTLTDLYKLPALCSMSQSTVTQAHQLLVRNCFVQLQLRSARAQTCLAVTLGRSISFMPLNEAVKASGASELRSTAAEVA